MFRVNHIVEIAKHSHQMPVILSFLIGMFLLNKEAYLFNDEDKGVGDNIPLTLIDSLKK
ncbi:MAG: hypothetical protein Q8R38_04230 [Candidatus Omnitrophota bacterium]|nr:hypothetical protein [Candidatus Omnitrophota bacterium]